MNHDIGILRQPNYLAFNCRANDWVEFIQLRPGLLAYFDSVGHCTCRGFHALNSPARSWRRASRNSAMSCGFCAVNQSSNSSRVSTDERTETGISTVSFGIHPAYRFSAANQVSSIRTPSAACSVYPPSLAKTFGVASVRQISCTQSAISYQLSEATPSPLRPAVRPPGR